MKYEKKGFGSLFVISSPSGGGKTTLVNKLLKHSSATLERAVTHTTRAARRGEVDGQHYHFVDIEEFKAMIQADGFLEYAEVFGNYYGTSRKEVDKKLADGKDVILVIDWQGAEQIKKIMPNAISIYILPPSLEALHARLIHRNLDSEDIVENRMRDAINQISHFNKFDYMVINDDFDIALVELRGIFQSNRLRMKYQIKKHEELLESLLAGRN